MSAIDHAAESLAAIVDLCRLHAQSPHFTATAILAAIRAGQVPGVEATAGGHFPTTSQATISGAEQHTVRIDLTEPPEGA